MLLYHIVVQIVFSYFGTLTFGLFINLPKQVLNISSIIGCAGWMLYWISFKLKFGSILANLLAAFLVGMLGIIFARKKKMPSTMFVSGLVPLVPGASGYQALAASINHVPTVAIEQMIHVAMVSGAIALGYILSQVVQELVYLKK